MKEKSRKIPIDRSARFYPLIATKRAQSIFSVSAIMKDDVDKDVLEVALNDVLPRFSAYKVRMKKGYGWHYFEPNDERAKVFDLPEKMLQPIDERATNGYLFRISCGEKQIKLEIFHALTDGNGAMAFLRTLICRYRELCGFAPVESDCTIDWRDCSTDDEIADAFEQNYKPVKLRELHLLKFAGKAPHRLGGTLLTDGYEEDISVANADDILKSAKKHSASFTVFVSALLCATIDRTGRASKPIALMVPVNLRALYGSNTMRNFVTFARIVIEPNKCKTLDDYVEEIKKQLKEKASKEKMDDFVSMTVRAQKNVIFRALPLFVKSFFLKLGRLFMRSRQTIIISNLGSIELSEQMGVERLVFNTNVSKNSTQNVGMVTLNGKTCFAFTRAVKEKNLPDAFFKALQANDVEVCNV